jgi:hypothetical protein
MTSLSLVDALEPWCMAGASGALRILGPPGGAVYLAGGRITYAETQITCGVNRMLTASGRMSTETLRASLGAARTDGVAVALTRPGLLNPIELEAMFLAAVHSAAFVAFDTHTDVRFEMGAEHPLSGVVGIELAAARSEIARRHDAMHQAWPYAIVDTSPVIPARRLDGHQVALTALQWEIAVNAGRRRTPFDIARLLGRDTYATLLAARRMVGSGLIQAPPVNAIAVGSDAPPVNRPAARSRTTKPSGVGKPAKPAGPHNGTARPVAGALPRRDGGGRGTAPPGGPDDGTDWSDTELLRIRDALQALR